MTLTVMAAPRAAARCCRRAVPLALLLASLGCAALFGPDSNLDQRPVWTGGIEAWKLAAASGPLDDTPAALFAEYPEGEHHFVVGTGSAPRGAQVAARDAAVEHGRGELAAQLFVSVRSETELQTHGTSLNDSHEVRESFDESIRTATDTQLSDVIVVREWVGFDGDDDVAFALLALDLSATTHSLGTALDQELSAADALLVSLEQGWSARDLAGLPARVAELTVHLAEARRHLQGLIGLAAADGRDAQVVALASDVARWHHLVLESLALDGGASGTFVRGGAPGELDLALVLDDGDRRLPVPDTGLRTDSGRLMTGADGRVTLAVALGPRHPEGLHRVAVRADLCRLHERMTDDCAACTLERELVWEPGYQVVHDSAAFDTLWAAADEAQAAGELAAARDLLAQARELVFDVPVPRERCRERHARLGVQLDIGRARQQLDGGQWAEALAAAHTAHRDASELAHAQLADQARELGVLAAAAYAREQTADGHHASRERCLTDVAEADRSWGDAQVREALQDLARSMPCEECGHSGRCQGCATSPRAGQVLDDCEVCRKTEGKRPSECPEDDCLKGFRPCPDDDQDHGWMTCPRCKGAWQVEHGRCHGEGCKGPNRKKNCVDGQLHCTRCSWCPQHKGWVDGCLQPGSVPVPCPTCKDSHKLRCSVCYKGPLVFRGRTWQGFVLEEDCTHCQGSTQVWERCDERCDEGTCSTCEGSAHRRIPG